MAKRAHSKNPADNAISRARPYIPIVQADQAAMARIREDVGEYGNKRPYLPQPSPERLRQLAGSPTPLTWADDHSFINATPLQQAPSLITLTIIETPILLFRKNIRRLSFTIGALNVDTVFFSYGAPIKAGALFMGLPITPALGVFANGSGVFLGSNGQASIDEIYVWVRAGATLPQFVIGYEGTLAPVFGPQG